MSRRPAASRSRAGSPTSRRTAPRSSDPLKCWWPIVSPSRPAPRETRTGAARFPRILGATSPLSHPEYAVRLARWTTLAAVVALALAACAPTDDSTATFRATSTGALETLEARRPDHRDVRPRLRAVGRRQRPDQRRGLRVRRRVRGRRAARVREGPRHVGHRELRPDHRARRQELRLRGQPGVDQRRAQGEPRLLLPVLHDHAGGRDAGELRSRGRRRRSRTSSRCASARWWARRA